MCKTAEEKEKASNISASWKGNTEKEKEKLKEQECKNITILELKAVLTKFQKLKLPGFDKVPNFWSNTLTSSNVTFTNLLNEIMRNSEKTPDWMCEGTTDLLPKSKDTKDSKNY